MARSRGINRPRSRCAVIFVCENNLYGASTPISLATRLADIAERAKAYGIPGFVVDGMDVTAVYQAARRRLSAPAGPGSHPAGMQDLSFPGHSRATGGYRTG